MRPFFFGSRDQIIEKWQKTYGKSPQIDETISLEEAISQLITLFESLDKNSKFTTQLKTLKQSISSLDKTPSFSTEKTYAEAVETLEGIKLSKFWADVKPILTRVRPFALQGGASTDHALLVIQDKSLNFEYKPFGHNSWVLPLDKQKNLPPNPS